MPHHKAGRELKLCHTGCPKTNVVIYKLMFIQSIKKVLKSQCLENSDIFTNVKIGLFLGHPVGLIWACAINEIYWN